MLPFITQPKSEFHIVGNELLGTLEIPKLHGLSHREQEFIDAKCRELGIFSNTELAIFMAVLIAKKLNKSVIETGNALLKGDFDFFADHLHELFDFNRKNEDNGALYELIKVTAIIKFRLTSDWTFEDTCNPEKISPGLIEEISNFISNDQSGWIESKPEESEPEE